MSLTFGHSPCSIQSALQAARYLWLCHILVVVDAGEIAVVLCFVHSLVGLPDAGECAVVLGFVHRLACLLDAGELAAVLGFVHRIVVLPDVGEYLGFVVVLGLYSHTELYCVQNSLLPPGIYIPE